MAVRAASRTLHAAPTSLCLPCARRSRRCVLRVAAACTTEPSTRISTALAAATVALTAAAAAAVSTAALALAAAAATTLAAAALALTTAT